MRKRVTGTPDVGVGLGGLARPEPVTIPYTSSFNCLELLLVPDHVQLYMALLTHLLYTCYHRCHSTLAPRSGDRLTAQGRRADCEKDIKYQSRTFGGHVP